MDILLLLLDYDNVLSSIVAQMLKTHNYQVMHFRNLDDAFGATENKGKTIKLILTSVGIADSKGYSSLKHGGIMHVVFFPEKDKEALIQALEGSKVTAYHIKSVNMDDVEDIWHHIFVHKQRKIAAINPLDNANKYPLQKQAVTPADSTSRLVIRDIEQPKGSSGGSEVGKKTRVVWTIELNNMFIEAYNQLGHQGATPCRILELMNDPRLTRFHIASHLQKYRAHLREMQEELNPRRSKFSYKLVSNPNLSSVNNVRNPNTPLPQEPVEHGTNDPYTYQPPVNQDLGGSINPAASFTKFLSNMEDEELFALAQNQEIPSLSSSSSSDLDLADLPNHDKFNDVYSMLRNCLSGETCSTRYVGFKISNEGELIWDKPSNQPIDEVSNSDMQLKPSQRQEQLNSGYDLVGSRQTIYPNGGTESPVTFDTDSCSDIYELLDFDSSIH